jgi:TonB family protein
LRLSHGLALLLLVPVATTLNVAMGTDPPSQPAAPTQPNPIVTDPHADPHVKWGPPTKDYYPEKARRKDITGRVGLEYSLDAQGRPKGIVLSEPSGSMLDHAAKKLLSDSRFKIPDDWSATGGPTQRYRIGVIFELIGEPRVAPFEDKRPTVVVFGLPYKK